MKILFAAIATKDVTFVKTFWTIYHLLNILQQKKIRIHLTCTTPNMIYLAYWTKCGKQGVGSTENWKPRLSNYKSHIKKKVKPCSILKHFIDSCTDTVNPSKYLRFILIDCVTYTENSKKEEIDDFLLEKENFWIGALCTIHKGLNDYNDWRHVRRNQKFNIDDWLYSNKTCLDIPRVRLL